MDSLLGDFVVNVDKRVLSSNCKLPSIRRKIQCIEIITSLWVDGMRTFTQVYRPVLDQTIWCCWNENVWTFGLTRIWTPPKACERHHLLMLDSWHSKCHLSCEWIEHFNMAIPTCYFLLRWKIVPAARYLSSGSNWRERTSPVHSVSINFCFTLSGALGGCEILSPSVKKGCDSLPQSFVNHIF